MSSAIYIPISILALVGLGLLRKRRLEWDKKSIINPKGGNFNCLACCIAAIKTAQTGTLHVASPYTPTGKLKHVAQHLSYPNSSNIAKMSKGYWTSRTIERWLDQVYPNPHGRTQHFIISIIAGKDRTVTSDRDAHALYAYRQYKNGKIETILFDPQTGRSKIQTRTYSVLGVTMINPHKINDEVMEYFRVKKVITSKSISI